MSSPKVGPSRRSLRVMIHPWGDHLTYDVMWVNHNGATGRSMRVASGRLEGPAKDIDDMTWTEALERVVAARRSGRKASPPPLGDMGEQLTLNLDLSA